MNYRNQKQNVLNQNVQVPHWKWPCYLQQCQVLHEGCGRCFHWDQDCQVHQEGFTLNECYGLPADQWENSPWAKIVHSNLFSQSALRCKSTPTWKTPSAPAASCVKDLTSAGAVNIVHISALNVTSSLYYCQYSETWPASTTSAAPAGSCNMELAFPTIAQSWGTQGVEATWTGEVMPPLVWISKFKTSVVAYFGILSSGFGPVRYRLYHRF